MLHKLVSLLFFFLAFRFFWVDRKVAGCSKDLWIPFLWMFFALSRFPSQWLDLSGPKSSGNLEGSPLDAVIFLALLVAGLVSLWQRGSNSNTLYSQNAWVWLYFCFGVLSILWSEYPFICLKRLVKAFGNIIMVMVVLADRRPYDALGVILRNLAWVLLPLSVIFIKYFPALGRSYHMGMPMFTGVADTKNGLGQICLIFGMYFSWSLLLNQRKGAVLSKTSWLMQLLALAIVGWLTLKANSATATAGLIIATCFFLAGSRPMMIRQPTRLFYLTLSGIAAFALLEWLFHISATLIALLGRRPDLTTRVPMWQDLIGMVKNPLVGFGFESFWLGSRRELMAERWGIDMQAHNGYLEMYLNMGLVGLFFIFSWVLSGMAKIKYYLSIDYPVALLRFCFMLVVLVYNWTEATFYGVSIMWMIFLFGIMGAAFQPAANGLPGKLEQQGANLPRVRRKKDGFFTGGSKDPSVNKLAQLKNKRKRGKPTDT